MSLLALLVLLSLSPPQDYQLQPLSPDELARNFINHRLFSGQTLDPIQIDRIQSSDNTCYAIRSYNFTREDGDAPQLVGTTTCTPANIVRNRTVQQPAARLVPLNYR